MICVIASDASFAQAFDTPRGAKRARRPAASPKRHSSGDEEAEEAPEPASLPASQLLTRISQVARWVVGMS